MLTYCKDCERWLELPDDVQTVPGSNHSGNRLVIHEGRAHEVLYGKRLEAMKEKNPPPKPAEAKSPSPPKVEVEPTPAQIEPAITEATDTQEEIRLAIRDAAVPLTREEVKALVVDSALLASQLLKKWRNEL